MTLRTTVSVVALVIVVMILVRVVDIIMGLINIATTVCFSKVCQKLTHIELSAYPDVFVLNRDLKWCPTFTKLKTLLLNEWYVASDHNALICFLKHSPALEKLTLELYKASQYPVKTDPLELPFASNHLKVEIKCEEVNGTVHKILSSLSTYGIPLNHIKIQQANRSSGSGYVNLVCTGFS